jgi:hypothetical protein
VFCVSRGLLWLFHAGIETGTGSAILPLPKTAVLPPEADRLCVLARETQLELWAEVLKPSPSPARLDAIAALARSTMHAGAAWYEEQLKIAQNSVVILRRFAKFELEVRNP